MELKIIFVLLFLFSVATCQRNCHDELRAEDFSCFFSAAERNSEVGPAVNRHCPTTNFTAVSHGDVNAKRCI